MWTIICLLIWMTLSFVNINTWSLLILNFFMNAPHHCGPCIYIKQIISSVCVCACVCVCVCVCDPCCKIDIDQRKLTNELLNDIKLNHIDFSKIKNRAICDSYWHDSHQNGTVWPILTGFISTVPDRSPPLPHDQSGQGIEDPKIICRSEGDCWYD